MQLIYFDESGNLGNTFKGPVKKQSCRYLTIAFLQIPENQKYKVTRIVRKVYWKEYQVKKTQGYTGSFSDYRKIELKGGLISNSTREYLINRLIKLKVDLSKLRIYSITVDKQKVTIPNWEQNRNLLYNYMIGLAVPKMIDMKQDVEFHPDPRSIKIGSANSLFEYLEIKLRFEFGYLYDMKQVSISSDNCECLQMIDFICNIIWRSYERNENAIFNHFKPVLNDITELFFRKYT
jgi:hypothetical protein